MSDINVTPPRVELHLGHTDVTVAMDAMTASIIKVQIQIDTIDGTAACCCGAIEPAPKDWRSIAEQAIADRIAARLADTPSEPGDDHAVQGQDTQGDVWRMSDPWWHWDTEDDGNWSAEFGGEDVRSLVRERNRLLSELESDGDVGLAPYRLRHRR